MINCSSANMRMTGPLPLIVLAFVAEFSAALPSGSPALPITPNPCGFNQSKCDNGQCIPASQVCDFIVQCLDKSDEQNCGSNCTFETGYCGFFQESLDDFDWTRTNRSSPSSGTGPDRDHTTGHGFYIYIETFSPRRYGEKAQLTSGVQKATDQGGVCLTFWYHMYGAYISTLNVYMRTGGSSVNNSIIWTRTRSVGNVWTQANIWFTSTQPYQVMFEGTVGHNYVADIALDDISLMPGRCSSSTLCDFEVDTCGYTQDTHDNFDWNRGRNGTSAGPSFDHTTDSDLGYYMYIESTAQRMRGDTARLISPPYPAVTAPKCVKFWYHMYGSQIGQLNVYVKSQGVMGAAAWTKSFNQLNQWHHGTVDVNKQAAWQIVFEGVIGSGSPGDIAIDDIRIVDGKCTVPGSCSFEFDTCGYSDGHNNGDRFVWLRSSGGTLSVGTGPSVDHTTNTDQGFYMYIEASGRNRNDRAWLYSEDLLPTSSSCLSFWYFMYGKDTGVLRVYQANRSKSMLIWSLNGNQGQLWINARININSTVNYQIIFDGEIGTGDQGVISIDDIAITRGFCNVSITTRPTAATSTVTSAPMPVDCNFDNDNICQWHQDTTDDFDWTLQQNSMDSINTGPAFDHTTETSKGYYIYTEASGRSGNSTARIVSPSITVDTVGKCLKFFFHMHGGLVGRLNVYAMQGTTLGRPIFTRIGEQNSRWNYGDIYLTPQTLSTTQTGPTVVQLVFEGRIGTGYQGHIALDDISLNDGPCPNDQICDFESSDMCSYQQDQTDNFDWTRAHGSTSLSGTGPRTDHTYGTYNGYYMYIEASAPRRQGDKARLNGPHFNQINGQCLQFYYHMNGISMGTLNVYLKKQGSLGHAVWSRSGNQASEWLPAQINLNSDVPFDVIFEGVVGSSYYSDIAIDDVTVKPRLCQPSGGCDFETDTCLWTNVNVGDDFDWLRGSKSTELHGSGPTTDHTLGTAHGHYMYIESSSPRRQGDRARLTSEVLRMPAGGCLTFWYSMYGSSMGTLNVYLDSSVVMPKAPLQNLWHRTGNQGSRWGNAAVSVQSPAQFRIIFEAIVGTSYTSDIAIDDLRVTPGLCSSTSTPPQFTCKNGQVISESSVCNFRQDCPDNSDELTCGNCTFESGLCSWNDASKGSFRWQIGQNSTMTSSAGPNVDHTLGTINGHFLYVDSAKGTVNAQATLASPTMRQSSSTCQMRFYYMNSGTSYNNGQITVSIQLGTRRTVIFRETARTGNTRTVGYADIGRISAPFQVLVEASRSNYSRSVVSVDDIAFINCAFPRVQASCNATTQFRCSRVACVDLFRVCDATDDCGDNSDEAPYFCLRASTCTFEQSFCHWTQSTKDNFNWIRHRGPTSSSRTGPTRDHTTNMNSGYYISIESSAPQSAGDKAQLLSRVIQSATPSDHCTLTFYYHMYGVGTGSLNVYMVTQTGGNVQKIWSNSGNRGDLWARATVQLVNTQNFQIMVEGVRGSTYTGDIAVDDTVISPNCK